ncbi:hypothetical protein ACFL1N_11960 [Thermodesulfobacteriota bacterium]
MKKLIMIFVLLFSALSINNAAASDDITGKWQGKLEPAPGSELVIQFNISKNDDGSYSVVLDSPDQGAIKNIKASSVVFDSGKLTMDVTELSGAYEGILKDGKFEGNWKQEGTSIPLNMKPYEKPVLTKEDKARLAGSWHGELKIPGNTLTLVFRFEMQEEDLRGFLDLPDSGAKGIPVTDIELSDGDLRLKAPSVAQLQYKAKFTDNEITGEVTIQGAQTFPLTLQKGEYKAPTYSLNLPREVVEGLTGEWHGTLKMPSNVIHVAFKFETNEKGEFVGYYEVPDQRQKIAISEANIKDGTLTLKIKVGSAEYKGKLDGDNLKGEWTQAGISSIPLSMKKGEYVPPVYNLDLPDDIKEQLTGDWYADVKLPAQTITITVNFKTTEKGEFVGIEDNLTQNAKGMPVFEATYSDGKLTFKIPNAEFKGRLDGDKLIGEVTLAGSNAPPSPTIFKKGKYVPPVYSLDLSEETKKILLGTWKGKVAGANIEVKFEKNEKGEFLGFIDNTDTDVDGKGLQITEASLSEGNLILKVKLINGEYKGELSGDTLKGEWIQGGQTAPMPLILKKD